MAEFEDMLNSVLSSPQEMEKIMGLAKELSGSLGGGGEAAKPAKSAPSGAAGLFDGLDPKTVSLITRLMGEFSSGGRDDKTALVEAIKPYIKSERGADLEKAVKIARLARLAKTVLPELGGDLNL